MSELPESIYLQWYGEDSPEDCSALCMHSDITWHTDKINEHDVKYIRADIVESLSHRLDESERDSALRICALLAELDVAVERLGESEKRVINQAEAIAIIREQGQHYATDIAMLRDECKKYQDKVLTEKNLRKQLENESGLAADEDNHLIDRLSKLLAGVAIALKGTEPELVMHSYHDLPELAIKTMIEMEIVKQRLEAAENDAARYRWLRTKQSLDGSFWVAHGGNIRALTCWNGNALDAEIDTAIAAEVTK